MHTRLGDARGEAAVEEALEDVAAVHGSSICTYDVFAQLVMQQQVAAPVCPLARLPASKTSLKIRPAKNVGQGTRGRSSLPAHHLAFSVALLAQAHQ